jgi:uncharacterized protein (DUF4415 family)
MNEKSTIVRHSLEEINALSELPEHQIRPDAPEAEPLREGFWDNAKIVMPKGKTSVHLRLDSDIVEWFKSNGKGHLTRMNTVLRDYVQAHK